MANESQKNVKLDTVMRLLDVSAVQLSQLCGVSNSLISRWQKGTRPLTARSSALRPLAKALILLDTNNTLDEMLAPWLLIDDGNKVEALCHYLTEDRVATPPELQRTGSYIVEQQAFLGKRGFNKAALIMLDYVLRLPPGQKVIVCAHSGYDLWHNDVSFALQVLWKMNQAIKQNTTFVLINREGPGRDGSPWFSLYWLTIHLKGIVYSRYYRGVAPPEHFVVTIPNYWSGRVEPDNSAEDELISFVTTDARLILKDEAHCLAYMEQSEPASQYGFLKNLKAAERNPTSLKDEDRHQDTPSYPSVPDGGFSAICRTPSFGIMTKEEFLELTNVDDSAALPGYLFGNGDFADAPHRIILCREDVREGLLEERQANLPLSELLHRDVSVPHATLSAQIKRLLTAMKKNEYFEVALMPRTAFNKLEMELVYWHDIAALGWLQDGAESMFDTDPVMMDSFASAMEYTWGKLHKGWKRYRNVNATLRNWLAGVGLDEETTDSAIVENWDMLPKKDEEISSK